MPQVEFTFKNPHKFLYLIFSLVVDIITSKFINIVDTFFIDMRY